MRYLLIDRVTEWKAGEHIRGTKNVAMTEDFLEFHFPGNPIMPGVLLIEALAQLSGWLEAASSDFTRWTLLTKVRSCRFYGFAFPGDQVELAVEKLPGTTEGGLAYRGTGFVKGKKKIVAEFEAEPVALSTIENSEKQKKFFSILTRE